jgi:hypothetical protein
LRAAGLGYSSLATGGIFGMLWYFIQRRSLPALVIALALFSLDSLAALAICVAGPNQHPSTGLFLRIFFLTRMVQGVGGIRALKRQETVQDVYAGA